MQATFSIAIGNGELMHKYFPKKETDEKGKKRGVSVERRKGGTKKRSNDVLSHPNQNTIINIIW